MKSNGKSWLLTLLLLFTGSIFSSFLTGTNQLPVRKNQVVSQEAGEINPSRGMIYTPPEVKILSWFKAYNIVWSVPSKRPVNSMPIGGGNIALNVWNTGDDLFFYIGSPDSWVDGKVPGQVNQVKLGRVRLTLSPNPFVADFRQELDLMSNSIRVSGTAEDGTSVILLIWVDTFKPVVHVQGQSSKPVSASVAIEIWRGKGRFEGVSAIWHYRNEGPSQARLTAITEQGIEAIASSVPDPIENLTFGGRLSGAEMVADDSGEGTLEGRKFHHYSLKTAQPVKQFDIQVTLRIAQDATLAAWEESVAELERKSQATTARDREVTAEWWKTFWNRSYIVINPDAQTDDPAWQAGRNYQLFRAMLGANRSGRFPNLFSGAAFIAETNPEERQWGNAGFTAQNQRLSYWPLLKTGDADVMRVALDFYASRLNLERAWAKHFWNVEGAVFPEAIDLFGMPVRMARKDGTSSPDVLRRHWTSGMEFALMMLEQGRYTGENIQQYLPVADAIVRFYDSYYRKQKKQSTGKELDEKGRLFIYPANALEVYDGALNPTCALSGLIALSDALLALPNDMISDGDREFYQDFRTLLPEIPVRMISDGAPPEKGYLHFHDVISPAEQWERERWDSNMELPQLYPVFPFRLYGVGRPDLELARNTWRYGFTDETRQKSYFGWFQGGIFTACLGLTEEALEYLLAKLLHPHWPDPSGKDIALERSEITLWPLRWMDPEWDIPRYPTFYDTMDFNQRPDMDHGSSGMIQLQEMLLQTVDDRILLFPAWPEEWDVDFKLHAPFNTVVEASVRNGKIINLLVTPESRRKDVEVLNGFE